MKENSPRRPGRVYYRSRKIRKRRGWFTRLLKLLRDPDCRWLTFFYLVSLCGIFWGMQLVVEVIKPDPASERGRFSVSTTVEILDRYAETGDRVRLEEDLSKVVGKDEFERLKMEVREAARQRQLTVQELRRYYERELAKIQSRERIE